MDQQNNTNKPQQQQHRPNQLQMPQQQQQQQQFQQLQQRPEELRRDILESAIIGQEQAKAARDELDKQGRRLRVSLGRTKQIAGQTGAAVKAVDRLISARKAGTLRTLLETCCCFGGYLCRRCCCCCCVGSESQQEADSSATKTSKQTTTSPVGSEDDDAEEDDAEDAATILRLDKLIAQSKQQTSKRTGSARPSWQETLEPLPEAAPAAAGAGPDSIWYHQVEACLAQLQQVAEEMGDSLDEQIRMAQILAIYLDFGADQALRANEKLAAATAAAES